MDERQTNVVKDVMSKALVLLYVGVVLIGGVRFIQTGDIANVIPEIIVAVAVPLLVVLFSLIGMRSGKKRVYFPMTIAGLTVSPDRTKEAKLGRVKAYFFESLRVALEFAVLYLIVTVFYNIKNLAQVFSIDLILGLVSYFVFPFVICFVFDYFSYERKSKKYCEQNVE